MSYNPQRRFYFREGLPAVTQATAQAQLRSAQARVLLLERRRREARLRRLLARERTRARQMPLQSLLAVRRTPLSGRGGGKYSTLLQGDLLWSGAVKRPASPTVHGDLLWHARSGGREAEHGGSLLGKIASILDKPFEWFSKTGYEVSKSLYLKGRTAESKGGLLGGFKAFGYYLAAGGEATAYGILAGLTGLVSPSAWKGTIDMFRHPKSTWSRLKASIIDNPFTINFLAGSVVGAAVGGKAVSSRFKGIYEPDMAGLRPGDKLEIAGWLDEGEVKWMARVNKSGPVYPAGRGASPPRPRPTDYAHIVVEGEELIEYSPARNTRIMLGENEAFEFKIQDVYRGRRVTRTWRLKYHDTGKTITAVEDWLFKGRLKPKSYKYRGEFHDPLQVAETVGGRRTPELQLWREVQRARQELIEGGWFKPPRLTVEPPGGLLGGAAGGIQAVANIGLPRTRPLSKPELFGKLTELTESDRDKLLDVLKTPPRLDAGGKKRLKTTPVPIAVPKPLTSPLTTPYPLTRPKPRTMPKPIQVQPPVTVPRMPLLRVPRTEPVPNPGNLIPPFRDIPPPPGPPGIGAGPFRVFVEPEALKPHVEGKRRSRRRKYTEVVYPAPVLPL